MTPRQWLIKNLNDQLRLPAPVVDWLIALYDLIQLFDDVADGDPVDRQDLNRVLWDALVAMPQNPFFIKEAHQLVPVVATQVLKWQASDASEHDGRVDAKTFMWRAGYYDVVLMCVCLVHGPKVATDVSEQVLRLYGEDMTDYKKEFENA